LRYRLFPHLTGATQFLVWARAQRLVVAPVSFVAQDMLFVPGSFWLGGYAPGLARKMRAAGGSVAAFVHDVLLLSHPEWMPGRHGAQFERGAASFLPQCDLIVCNSQNTRDELRRCVTLPPEVVIEVGRLADRIDAEPLQPEVSLAGKQFALFVSSLTPRKNHVLAVRAWNLLRNELAERTPYLVLVGGGHPDAALAAAMADDAHGAPRVLRLRDVTDAELAWLYRHAWLTLYPSLGEGYGLPVAEAMAFGKLCIASRAGGIAEIAQDLVDVADLHDPAALAALVQSYFMFPERLDAREQAIKSRYRSTGWTDCAEIVGQHLAAARERKDIMRPSEQNC
jgi:glycosyltransferase involved in cell wall biosynthesis